MLNAKQMLLPGEQHHPVVVALVPSTGTDDAIAIRDMHMTLRSMGAPLDLRIIGGSADGAASELAAQNLMDREASELAPLEYSYPAYGVLVQAPVYKTTGPFISHQDAPHARKTGRNQLQHGTKASSLGTGYMVNRVLVDLYETKESCLVRNDVFNVDKQDDGAARRFYHASVLEAATTPGKECDDRVIKKKYSGIFVYDFFIGKSTYTSKQNAGSYTNN